MKNLSFKFIVLIAVLALCWTFTSISSEALEPQKTINIFGFIELLAKQPKTQIIDVRPSEKRAVAYVKGSVNIPINSIQTRIGEINPEEPVVIIDQDGSVSQASAQIIENHVKAGIFTLENGIDSFYDFLSRENEIVSKKPDNKKIFSRIRELLVTGSPIVGLTFPTFSLQGQPDKRSTLVEFAGRTILLAFFSTADENQFAEIVRLKNLFSGTLPRLAFLPVAVYENDKELGKFKKYLRKNNWTGQIFFDKENKLMRRIGIDSIPNYNFVDGSGVLRVLNFTGKHESVESYSDMTLDQLAGILASGNLTPYPIPIGGLSEFRQKKLIGTQAPDFYLPSTRGSHTSISSYKNKKNIFLIFGSIDCPYTRKEMETANECYEKYKDTNNFVVLAVVPGLQKSLETKARDYVSQFDISFPILLSPKMDVFEQYHISSVPVWWMLDQSGVIRVRGKGYNPDTCDELKRIFK
jgi:peroxiredoxin/rhodanese-related sulfurtransferase